MNNDTPSTQRLKQWISKTKPVMTVIKIDRPEDAVPLAEALIAGGIHLLEITLRTEHGLKAIEQVSRTCPDAIVGAGTITSKDQFQTCHDVGAQFFVSPGCNADLLQKAKDFDQPYLPGVMTPSDIMLAMQHGYDWVKLFPAQLAKGLDFIKAMSGPFPDLYFCPTGGLNADNYRDFLALKNIPCIGGSWICPTKLIEKNDWIGITALAEAVRES